MVVKKFAEYSTAALVFLWAGLFALDIEGTAVNVTMLVLLGMAITFHIWHEAKRGPTPR